MADKIPMLSYRDYTKSNISTKWFWETGDPTVTALTAARADYKAQGKIIGEAVSNINEYTARYSTVWDCADSISAFGVLPVEDEFQLAMSAYNDANSITATNAVIEQA